MSAAAMNTSGGWEKVGNGGKGGKSTKANGTGKFTKTEKKKFAETAPKLEDVLTRDQIASVWSMPDIETDKSSSSPPKPAKNNSNKAAKNGKANSDKKASPEKKPATIEEAVKKVSVNELKTLLEKVRDRYPENPILWIRDAAAYFNVALATESPVPLTSFSEHPLSLLTKETRKTLTALFEQCPEAARQTGFETLLANMAHDMGKGLTANGNLVVLQLMSEIYPSLASHNMARYNELRNSYQNRAQIGTAMLWALGQGGRKDLVVGINVWLDFMLPVLTMKNYSRFVVEYLSGLLAHHSARVKSGKRILFSRQLFLCFDALFATANNLNRELQAELQKQYDALKKISIGDCAENHEIFPEFLRRLQTVSEDKYHPRAREELLEALALSVANNPATLKHWQQMYLTYLPASAQLLEYLDKNWSSYGYKLRRSSTFLETIAAFEEHAEASAPSSSKPGMEEAAQAVSSVSKRLGRGRDGQGGGGFRWKLNSVLLLAAIGFLVNRDLQRHGGSFVKSKSGVFLADVGLYEPVMRSIDYGAEVYDAGYGWAEKNNLPGYVKEARKKADPYIAQAVDAASRGLDLAKQSAFDLQAKVEQKYPNLKKDAEKAATAFVSKFEEVMLKIWSAIVYAGEVTAKFAIDVKDGKVTFCCVKKFAYDAYLAAAANLALAIDYCKTLTGDDFKKFAYDAYLATSANMGMAIEYCKTQIEVMTK